MLATTTYQLFLEKIKKEFTSAVPPEVFTNLINDSCVKVVLSKLPGTELVSKRVEDLSQLLVTVDGIDYPLIETEQSGYNTFLIPRMQEMSVGNTIYPQALKILNVGFQIYYKGHICLPDGLGDDFESASLMKTDQRYQIMENPHRIPTLGPPAVRIYFQLYKDKIRAILSRKQIESYAKYLRIEYYRYPVKFYFDENDPINGSTPLEFRDEVCREIIDHAALSYIERVQDPRFQTKKIENKEDEINN